MLWKVYARTQDFSIWAVIHRWIKTYGNPYEEKNAMSYEEHERRQYYILALDYVIKKWTNRGRDRGETYDSL